MDIQALRERVDLAAQQEQQAASLGRWLEQRLPSLHPSIAAKDSPRHSLLHFIDGYIRQVPDMLEAAQRVAEQAEMRSQLRPVLKVAEAFFLQPPDLPADHSGMLALLDEAYLAHRLIEEVNEGMKRACPIALAHRSHREEGARLLFADAHLKQALIG